MKTEFLKKYNTPSLLLIGVIFLLAGCVQAVEIPETEAAFVLPENTAIADFKLTHPELGEYDNDSIKGKWSLFFFGYTHCPDVCPSELFMMAAMMREIESNPSMVIQPPQVVFVSIDPQRDTPELLQQYASFYHPSFIGVTGKQPVIDRLAESMGVYYVRVYHSDGMVLIFDPQEGVPEGFENSYLINHIASIFLVNPDGKLQAIFSPPHKPDAMLRDLVTIQRE